MMKKFKMLYKTASDQIIQSASEMNLSEKNTNGLVSLYISSAFMPTIFVLFLFSIKQNGINGNNRGQNNRGQTTFSIFGRAVGSTKAGVN